MELVATRQSEALLLVASQIKVCFGHKGEEIKSRVTAQRAQITILIVHEAAVGQLRFPTGLASRGAGPSRLRMLPRSWLREGAREQVMTCGKPHLQPQRSQQQMLVHRRVRSPCGTQLIQPATSHTKKILI